jgi:hypothetical protein
MDVYELLVVFGMFSHVFDHTSTDFGVLILIAADLVGESVEEAVA